MTELQQLPESAKSALRRNTKVEQQQLGNYSSSCKTLITSSLKASLQQVMIAEEAWLTLHIFDQKTPALLGIDDAHLLPHAKQVPSEVYVQGKAHGNVLADSGPDCQRPLGNPRTSHCSSFCSPLALQH